MSDNRILKQFCYFDRTLQCTVVTSTWLHGPPTTDYHYTEQLPDGLMRTRIESIPRSVGPRTLPVTPPPPHEQAHGASPAPE